MTLHPQAVAALARPKVPLSTETLAEARAVMIDAVPDEVGPGMMVPVVRNIDADGVPARLYDPRNGHGAPVAVYLHGGGWTLGNLDTADAVCRRLANRSGCAVFSIDYRCAPEHPFPAAIDDVERAVAWIRANAADCGVDPSALAVIGDSAGGHLAAVTSRRGRDAGTPFRYQVLVYPVIDPAMDTPSYAEHGHLKLLSTEEMRFYWSSFVPEGIDREQPDVNPARGDLAGLPPTLVITAECDVLRDEGEAYATALAAAGVSVVTSRYQGMVHGFFRKLALFDAGTVAVDQAAAALYDGLSGAQGSASR